MSAVDVIAAFGTAVHLAALAITEVKEHHTDASLKLYNDSQDGDHQQLEKASSLSSSSSPYICVYYTTSLSALVCTAISIYLTLAVLYNLIAWYKFVAAWNLILQARRMDIANARNHHPRRSYKQLLRKCTAVSVKSMCSHVSCPICLTDFYEQELVTPCDDGGCGNWFHRECLFEWLDRSESCPCCRKDMLTPPPRGLGDIVPSCFGFSAR
jgi:hypothetical protein